MFAEVVFRGIFACITAIVARLGWFAIRELPMQTSRIDRLGYGLITLIFLVGGGICFLAVIIGVEVFDFVGRLFYPFLG